MLWDIFSGDIEPLSVLLWAVAALCAMTIHELSHALIAYRLGDPTAKQMGRLTLNPVRHIDLVGLLMIMVAGFGWAKPVPVDMRYFKNQKRGMALTAAAGPASNFILAFISYIIYFAIFFLTDSEAPSWIFELAGNFVTINIVLGIFNLFPIPPLDGSKILGMFLPDKAYYNLMRYERYGMLAVAAFIMIFRRFGNNPLDYLIDLVLSGFGEAAYFLTSWMG